MNILKNIFAIIVILIFVGASFFFLVIEGGVYQELFGDSATSTASGALSNSTASSTNQLVQTLQNQLIELDRVKIDSEFFDSNAFRQLESNRQELPVLEGQKENPFLSQ